MDGQRNGFHGGCGQADARYHPGRRGRNVVSRGRDPPTNWITYTGATNWNNSGEGQYSAASRQPSATPDWVASNSYAAGAFVNPLLNNAGGVDFYTTSSCTSGTTEPNPWDQTPGGTSNDNGGSGGCTWTDLGGSNSGPIGTPCVYTFSSTSGATTGYSLCIGNTGTAYLNRSGVNVATSSAAACGALTTTFELRTLNGINEPLCGGATPSGMSASYTDGSPLTTGNPGVSGSGAYNWTGGTINASSAPTPISWSGIPGGDFAAYGPFAFTSIGCMAHLSLVRTIHAIQWA